VAAMLKVLNSRFRLLLIISLTITCGVVLANVVVVVVRFLVVAILTIAIYCAATDTVTTAAFASIASVLTSAAATVVVATDAKRTMVDQTVSNLCRLSHFDFSFPNFFANTLTLGGPDVAE
jgi:hypothetical protein